MSEFFTQENLEQFYKTHPDSLVFAHLASHLMKQGDYQRAIDICNEGLAKHPTYAYGHYILGLAHYYLKSFTEAKREIEIALAYDSEIPRAWRILTNINESLNLGAFKKESQLFHYLSDPFNEKAAEQYFQDNQEQMTSPEQLKEDDGSSGDRKREESSISEKDFDSLIDETISPSESEETFESTLDTVFKETISDFAEQEEGEKEDVSSQDETKSDQSSDHESKETEDTLNNEDFTSAMDSFFSEYEQSEDDQNSVVVEKDDTPSDQFLESETEEKDQEDSAVQEKKRDDVEESDFPEEFVDEESIDYSAVVSDFISESVEGDDESKVKEQNGSEFPDADSIESESSGFEENMFSSGDDESRITEETIPESESDKTKATESPESKQDSSEQFGKPPILSPTLGEIYIAQGRFGEAIDVFRKLLEKNPDNARYKRKIDDIKKIVEKQQS